MSVIFAFLMLIHVLTEALLGPFATLALFSTYHQYLSDWIVYLALFGLLMSTVLILSQFSMQNHIYSTAKTAKNLLKYLYRAIDPFLVAGIVAWATQSLFLAELLYLLSISFGVRMAGHLYAAVKEWHNEKEKDWGILLALPFLFSGLLPFAIVMWNVILSESEGWRVALIVVYTIYAAIRYGQNLRI